jgi:hypothetical protein
MQNTSSTTTTGPGRTATTTTTGNNQSIDRCHMRGGSPSSFGDVPELDNTMISHALRRNVK